MPPPPHSRRHQDTWFLRFISATNQLFVVTTDLASFSRISEIELLSGGGMLLRTNQSAVVRRTVHSLHFCDTLLMFPRLSRITLRQRARGMAAAWAMLTSELFGGGWKMSAAAAEQLAVVVTNGVSLPGIANSCMLALHPCKAAKGFCHCHQHTRIYRHILKVSFRVNQLVNFRDWNKS
jgi:hypothetical protein